MDSPFLGQIQLFAFPFAPMGWAECAGQSLNVNQNAALYSLIGNLYGGNGSTTFNLPNLRGAEPVPNMKYYIAVEGLYPQRP
jgi:microcystin-dependent protein